MLRSRAPVRAISSYLEQLDSGGSLWLVAAGFQAGSRRPPPRLSPSGHPGDKRPLAWSECPPSTTAVRSSGRALTATFTCPTSGSPSRPGRTCTIPSGHTTSAEFRVDRHLSQR